MFYYYIWFQFHMSIFGYIPNINIHVRIIDLQFIPFLWYNNNILFLYMFLYII